MGLFNWFKWTKLIISAENKFTNIYNFEVPFEHKQYNKILPLAFCVLFEEMRINKLSPDDAKKVMESLRKDSPLYQFITPVGRHLVDWNAYKTIYHIFIDYRARKERPIIATMLAMNFEEKISEEEKKELRDDYNNNPFFGDTV